MITENTETVYDLEPCLTKKKEKQPLTVQSKLVIESHRGGYYWPSVKIELTDKSPFAIIYLSEISIPLVEGITKEVVMEIALRNSERDDEYKQDVIDKLNLVFDEYEKHKHCFN